MIATHQLYHGRKLVNNIKVSRRKAAYLDYLPAITEEVQPRGIPTGNKMGVKIITRPDCEVIKKSPLKPIDIRGLSINYRFKKDSDILKPRIKYNGIEKSSIPAEIADIIDKIQKMPLLEVLPAP